MSPSRKSPAHPMAAMFTQIHPSPATWVVFERTDKGEFRIDKVGQFMTSFCSDRNRIWEKFRATFRTSYVHPYFGQEHWQHTPAELGLVPIETFPRFGWLNEPLAPPTDGDVKNRFYAYFTPMRDKHDPYTFWQIHLAEFYKEMEASAGALFWQEEDDKRRAAEEADELI